MTRNGMSMVAILLVVACGDWIIAEKMAASAAFAGTQSASRVFVSTPTSKLPKRTVGDCMQSNILTLTPQTTVDEAMDLFLRFRVHGAPVVVEENDEKSKLVGMVSQFDFLSKEAFEGALLPLEGTGEHLEEYVQAAKKICGQYVEDVMSSRLVTVKSATSMREAADLMTREKLHHLPVVDDGRGVVGMLSTEDVMRDLLHIMQKLPEAAAAVDANADDDDTTNAPKP